MSVYISVHGLRPRLLLVGAGHVNRAVAHAAARVDFDICVGDIYSASLCPDAFPLSARLVHAASFTDVVEAMAVRTAGFRADCHQQPGSGGAGQADNPAGGVAGAAGTSRRKVQAFVRQMRENGVTEADISRLRAPIGYDIGAETPNEIAISVLAEILQVKNGAPGGLMNQVRQACQPDCLAEAVEV
ncbi:XdhC family protein [Klebsiella michiganensis]|nr:XdhC family protein [Klebsiella michiganensis]